MRRVPVKGTSYVNKWGTLVKRRPHRRRVPGGSVGSSPTYVRSAPVKPEPRRRAKSPVVVVVIVILLGAAAAVTVALTDSSAGATASQIDARPMSTESSADDFKNARAAFLASGYRHIDFAVQSGSNCEQHSYGKVQVFFKSDPCEWLTRAYLAIHDSNLGEVLVALSWVGMPSAASATAYKKLVDKGGTGNITELSRDTGPYRTIKYSGEFYTSGLDGSSVWNVQLQPVGQIPTAFVSEIFDRFKQ
jgi:hypothetical protein